MFTVVYHLAFCHWVTAKAWKQKPYSEKEFPALLYEYQVNYANQNRRSFIKLSFWPSLCTGREICHESWSKYPCKGTVSTVNVNLSIYLKHLIIKLKDLFNLHKSTSKNQRKHWPSQQKVSLFLWFCIAIRGEKRVQSLSS